MPTRTWLAANCTSSGYKSALACISLACGTGAKGNGFLLKSVL